jgi:outer membrane lipoprotein carrier protein
MLRLVLSALCVCLLAQTAGAASLTEALQQKYSAMKSFTASFEQVLVHKESGMRESRRGTLDFSKPLLIRWETKEPSTSKELLVVGSKDIWNYLPDEAIAYRMPLVLVQDSRSIIQVITGQARLDTDFTVKQQDKEKGLVKLRLYPKEPLPQMVEATIWVDEANMLIRRAVIVDFYGNTNDITMNDLKPDAPVAASAFSFTPPKGVEVEDRMDASVQEKALLN